MRIKILSAAVSAALIMTLCAVPLGCGGGGEAAGEIVLERTSLQDCFALYYPVPSETRPSVASYRVDADLSNVAGREGISLPAGAARALVERGFILVSAGQSQIHQVYKEAGGAKFVTADAILHAFHLLYRNTQRYVEAAVLLPNLEKLIASMRDTVRAIYDEAEGRAKSAALSDLAFLDVPAALLGLGTEAPEEIGDEVSEELRLIEECSALTASPLFGYQVDYTRYLPSGHYNSSGELEGYFKAMTWLGDMGFYPRQGDGASDVERGRDMARRAIVLVGGLHMSEVEGEPALEVWDDIQQCTSFMVGTSEDVDAITCSRVMEETLGRRFPLSDLEDDARVDEFVDGITRESSRENGTIVPGNGDAGEGEISFRLFGRRTVPDAHIFQELVEDKVPGRLMPRGLDIPAAFGSDRALEILDAMYGETGYEGYTEAVHELREGLSRLGPAQARSSIHGGVIDMLRILLRTCGEGYPAFMKSVQWQDRDLQTFTSSWTELHHDSMLVAEGSLSAETAMEPYPEAGEKGYVEPRPDLFASLAAVTDMFYRGLVDRGLADQALLERLECLHGLTLNLKEMAEKELRNEPLSAEEYAAIAAIGETLEYLSTMPSGEESSAPWADTATAAVTDAYYDPNYGELLEMAVGRPSVYYVVAPVEGTPTLLVGAGYSYYEFVKPAAEPLSDEAWRGMLEAGTEPAPPAWTSSFLSP